MKNYVALLLIFQTLLQGAIEPLRVGILSLGDRGRASQDEEHYRVWLENRSPAALRAFGFPMTSPNELAPTLKARDRLATILKESLESDTAKDIRSSARTLILELAETVEQSLPSEGELLQRSYVVLSFLNWLNGDEDLSLKSYRKASLFSPLNVSADFVGWDVESRVPDWIAFKDFIKKRAIPPRICEVAADFSPGVAKVFVNGFPVRGRKVSLVESSSFLEVYANHHLPYQGWISCDDKGKLKRSLKREAVGISADSWREIAYQERAWRADSLLIVLPNGKQSALYSRRHGVQKLTKTAWRKVLPGVSGAPAKFQEDEMVRHLSILRKEPSLPTLPKPLVATNQKWYHNKIVWWLAGSLAVLGTSTALIMKSQGGSTPVAPSFQ